MNIPDEAVRAAAWSVGNLSEGKGFTEIVKATRKALEDALPHLLRAAAEVVDVDGVDVDYEEVTEGAGRRHAADDLRDLADKLDPQ